jgi:uncharacterized Zn finger protein (UPF0148 family)
VSKCKKCGYELSHKDKFCPSCGAKHKIEENNKIEDNIDEDNKEDDKIVEKTEYVEFIEHKEKKSYDENTINVKANTNRYDKMDDEPKLKTYGEKFSGLKVKAVASAIILVLLVGFGITYMTLNKNKNNTADSSNSSNKQTSTDNKKIEETDENLKEYILPYSNKKPLTKNDLKNLSKKQLQLARNEIFARHGYVFGEPFKSYFKAKSWYKEDSSFTGEGKQLSPLERHNIKTILIQEGLKVAPGYDSDYKESEYTN